MASLEEEMVASYSIEIDGVQRTRFEMAKLDAAIASLRAGKYSETSSVTAASNFAGSDIFVSRIDRLEGRIQTAAGKAMLAGMDFGKQVQAATLRAATTQTGASGASHDPKKGRTGGAGREDSGTLIKQIKRNVEVFKSTSTTFITGWHGWREGREDYFKYQESGSFGSGGGTTSGVRRKRRGSRSKGNSGVPAANSLGAAIVPVREFLKRELGYLK